MNELPLSSSLICDALFRLSSDNGAFEPITNDLAPHSNGILEVSSFNSAVSITIFDCTLDEVVLFQEFDKENPLNRVEFYIEPGHNFYLRASDYAREVFINPGFDPQSKTSIIYRDFCYGIKTQEIEMIHIRAT